MEYVMLTEVRTEQAKKLRRENMKKRGVDFSARRDKVLVPRKDKLVNALQTSLTKDHYVLMYHPPHGARDQGLVLRKHSPTVSTSGWEHNNLLVSGIPRLTSTQYQFLKNILGVVVRIAIGSTQKNSARMIEQSPALTSAMGQGGDHVPMVTNDVPVSPESSTTATSRKSTQKNYQTLTASSVGSLVRRLASQENDGDSMIPEVRSFLTSHGFLGKSNHAILFLRTSKGYYLTTKETLSAPSLPRLMNWGTTVNGKCLTAKISASRKTEKGSTLSDILEEHPDPKYFLSQEQTQRILSLGLSERAVPQVTLENTPETSSVLAT